jgi:hypothetical protein
MICCELLFFILKLSHGNSGIICISDLLLNDIPWGKEKISHTLLDSSFFESTIERERRGKQLISISWKSPQLKEKLLKPAKIIENYREFSINSERISVIFVILNDFSDFRWFTIISDRFKTSYSLIKSLFLHGLELSNKMIVD